MSAAKQLNLEILANDKIADSLYNMRLKSPYISQNASPGQFINIKCADGLNAILRRPISILDVDREKETVDITYQVRGAGTKLLSQRKPGEILDVLGPLGRPFDISKEYKNIAVVGGGIGIFPLMYLLKASKSPTKSAFIGFRDQKSIVYLDEFQKNSTSFNISTDDGCVGCKGSVVDMFKNELEKGKFDVIYTCGPSPMIKAVVKAADEYGIKCQVSLEERMACGFGVCTACACKIKNGDEWKYGRVCKDGPVFWSDEVVFEDE